MAVVGIIGIEWFNQIVLPFVLVFTLIFAILEKSKILGEDKHQVNSIIALAVGFLIVGVGVARDMIGDIIPVIAVVAVVIFVFMLLIGFTGGKEGSLMKEGNLSKPLQITIAILVTIVLIITLLYSSGRIPLLANFFKNPDTAPVYQSVIFIIITAAIVAVLLSSSKKESKD